MRAILLIAAATPLLFGCATGGPTTSWGKQGVSMEDYRVDGATCAALAATANPDADAANSAGGINGKNSSQPATPTVATGPSSGASGAAFPTGGGGAYRDSAPPDMVQRAATQQRTQEMAVQRLRAEKLKSCLTERGYSEFNLTPEQRAELARLPAGSAERREYLYKLGTDPEVLKKAHKPTS